MFKCCLDQRWMVRAGKMRSGSSCIYKHCGCVNALWVPQRLSSPCQKSGAKQVEVNLSGQFLCWQYMTTHYYKLLHINNSEAYNNWLMFDEVISISNSNLPLELLNNYDMVYWPILVKHYILIYNQRLVKGFDTLLSCNHTLSLVSFDWHGWIYTLSHI